MDNDLNEDALLEAIVTIQEETLETCAVCKLPVGLGEASIYVPAGPDECFGKCYHSACKSPESYGRIAQEREACAAIADYHAQSGLEGEIWIATKIAERIRARGK